MHEHKLTFSLLGMVRARYGSKELDLGPPQQRAILSMLLLHRGSVASLDELIGGLWGEEPPRSAVTTVRTYVSRLRRAFSEAALADLIRLDSVRGGYLLQVAEGTLDVSVFRRHTTRATQAIRQGDFTTAAAELRAALTLCHGQPLADTVGPYVEGQRVRLQEVVTAAQVELLKAQVHLGHFHEAIPDLTTMVPTHPLREELHELLMAALYGSGRGAEALEHYLKTRRTFVDDIGIEPGGRLRELQQRILAEDPSLPISSAPQIATTDQLTAPYRLSASALAADTPGSSSGFRRLGTTSQRWVGHRDQLIAASTN